METMETVEVYEDVRMAEEVESCYTLMEVTSPKRKKKSKAQEEIIEKPKKPRSAYLLYYFDVHQIMQQDSPNLPQSEINKRISESWKRLNVAEKGHYLEKAKLEREGIDTSSLGPSQDLPGFRKILPRASYVLLPKGSSSDHQAAGSHLEVCMESLGSAVDSGLPSVSLPQEPQFPPLALGSEVEFAEQCIAIEGLAEEAAATSHPTALQGILSSSSSSSSSYPSSASKASACATAPAVAHNSQNSAGLLLRGSESRVVGSGYSVVGMATEEGGVGGAVVQQMKGETAQVVTIIPTQSLLESKSLPGASSVAPVMMVPVGTSIELNTKPSYKMAVKTYTRRGRGRCLAPGCSFVYVTRHKPPTCPECGSHLGGKWVPNAKKTKAKTAASKQTPQKAETNSSDNGQPSAPPAEDNANGTGARREGRAQRSTRKQHAVTGESPLEGSSAMTQTRAERSKPPTPGTTVRGQDRNNVTVLKRPVRPILPAFCNTGRALVQFITVPPEKGQAESANSSKSAKVPSEKISGLKPSTLKQLGQTVATTTGKQNFPVPTEGSQYILTDRGGNILSVMPFKQNNASSFDLGLSTARGRGRCKNPSCDYVYKNRHKPADCPSCGWELSRKNAKGAKSGALLDPYQALTPAQKDLQRQSTLQLLRRGLQIPESETELQETLALIQELNSPQVVLTQSGDRDREDREDRVETETLVQSGWPRFYESAATHCGLCHYPLFKGGQSTVAGQEDCWLLTETLIQTASLQLKVCSNTQCLALHSFTDLHPGLFNIGNRLLVSVDLFLKIRMEIKLGRHPSQAASTILDHVPNHPAHALSAKESTLVQELLLSGYWAFECLTVRDYNDMICGVCGVAPKLEIAQRFTHNVLELRNVEFTWPEFSSPDEVHVDDFWLTMESEAIEQAAFPSDIPITRVDASIVSPFIPPLMRSPTVINTEKDKVPGHAQQHSGDPSVLVRLIHEGRLRPDCIEEHSAEELKSILSCCGVTIQPDSTQNDLLVSLISLYTRVQTGLSTAPQPPPHHTAGKLSKICPHKVVCGSKYMVRGETARDHVDLLLSSRYWSPVYVTDSARQVALCADMQYPELASQMWGRNQGCFSDPMEKPEYVSCVELQDQPYSADLSSVGENQLVHPVTKSSSRWLVHPAGTAEPQDPPEHHAMGLCKELEPYASLVAELEIQRQEEEKEPEERTDSGEETLPGEEAAVVVGSSASGVPQRHMAFDNAAYYYLYNRLVDFLSSRDIVSQQISQVLKACQPGEVVIRDALYRLGVAQINTEEEEEEEEEEEGEGDATERQGGEGAVEEGTVYELVVP